MDAEGDKTVRLKVARSTGKGQGQVGTAAALSAVVALAMASGAAWWFWPRSAQPPDAQPPARTAAAQTAPQTPVPSAEAAAPPQAAPSHADASGATGTAPATIALAPPVAKPAPAPAELPPLATSAEILADNADHLVVYRFAPQPEIVVLQFPSLHQQALTLNRVAALIEKAGYPHDVVLGFPDLDARIRAGGDDPDTFYYGHDYRAADLERFFALAPSLDPEESDLQTLLAKLGWTSPSQTHGALISLVRASASMGLDAQGRAAILEHEVSHGFYFTDPDYADYCRRFWRDTLTEAERQKFVTFLKGEGYDTGIEDLVINESQAYLMHTPDRRFFDAAQVGISPARLAELRQIFVVRMPSGWLRDHTSVDPPGAAKAIRIDPRPARPG